MQYLIIQVCIILYGVKLVYSNQNLNDFQYYPANELPTNNITLKTSTDCNHLIIFDLSKSFTSEEVFEITIKKFLSLINQFCHKFKYAVMVFSFPEDCTGKSECGVNIKECDDQKACEEHIILMDYSNMTLSYSIAIDGSNTKLSKTYLQFLNATLSTINSCEKENSVLLLTNRIVFMDINNDIIKMIQTFNIKFTTILLGRNDTSTVANFLLPYANFPNFKTLSFANFDCLNYLLYCILPCSDTVIECVRSDLDDCHAYSALTPNKNPEKTLHIWFVLSLTEAGTDKFYKIFSNMVQGMKNYINMFGIQNLRFGIIESSYKSVSYKTCEDIDSIDDYCSVGFKNVDLDGFPIGDDGGITNQRLSLIPWSNALTKTRIGIFSVIILTDFATPNLITFNGIQNLLAQIYVYNSDAYKYYSEKYKNSTDINVSLLNWSDVVTIVPINNGGSLPTTTNMPVSTTYETTQNDETNTPTAMTEVMQNTEITADNPETTFGTTKSLKNSANSYCCRILQPFFLLLISLNILSKCYLS